MASSLPALIAALEDDPWCGTRPPHWPPRPPKHLPLEEAFVSIEAMTALNPQPLPPRWGMLSAVAFQSVRLYQIGRELERQGKAPAETGQQLMSYASGVYDEICGSVPISVLIAWLLHHKPPPPPPWLREIEQVATQSAIASRMEGSIGAPMQQACLGLLKDRIGQLNNKGTKAQ